MKRTGDRDAGHEALLREAVSWFVRVHDEQASAADFNAWQEWMMRDARHQQAFQSVEDFWQASGSVKQPAWPLIEELGADTYDGAIPVAQWQAAAEQTSGRQTGTYFRPRFLAAAATLLAAVGAAWFFMTPRAPALVDSDVASTPAAQVREYRLSDGSRITLGAGSRIRVDYTAAARRLTVEAGEAFFAVARDPQRPFVVHAGSGTITALGTAFNVRSLAGRVVVTVVEGKVEVEGHPSADTDAQGGASQLGAGQTVAYGEAPSPVRTVDTSIATAWRSGQLKYLHEPLKFVIADVARVTGRRLHIEDARVGELLYTGSVLPAEVDDWLTSVAASLPVAIAREADGTVRFTAAAR